MTADLLIKDDKRFEMSKCMAPKPYRKSLKLSLLHRIKPSRPNLKVSSSIFIERKRGCLITASPPK